MARRKRNPTVSSVTSRLVKVTGGLSLPGVAVNAGQGNPGTQLSVDQVPVVPLPRPSDQFNTNAFGPLVPINAMPADTPGEQYDRAQPRRWQYPVGWNMPVGIPGTEGIKLTSFQNLRALAEVYSIARACVKTRKDEILGLDWDVVPTDSAAKAMSGKVTEHTDFQDRRSEVVQFFKRPDPNYRTFQGWMGSILEDLFVIDAPAVYIHPSRVPGKGLLRSSLAALEVIDGATIRPLLDIRGSKPQPPAPAYQQYLWGVPRTDLMDVVEYSADANDSELDIGEVERYRGDQLIYAPYETRSWTPYGFPPIEQALIPAITGLEKQKWALEWFNSGSVPAMFVSPGPGVSTPQQIEQLQRVLNAIAGDLGAKHQIIVLPAESKTMPMKPPELANQFDEILAVQICMAFGIMPMELGISPKVSTTQSPGASNQMAKASQEINERKGIKPLLQYLKQSIFDYVIQEVCGQADMEFQWVGLEEEEDLATKVGYIKDMIGVGLKSVDEGRVDLSLNPWGLPLTSDPVFIGATGPVPFGQIAPAVVEQETNSEALLDPRLLPSEPTQIQPPTPPGGGGGSGQPPKGDGSPPKAPTSPSGGGGGASAAKPGESPLTTATDNSGAEEARTSAKPAANKAVRAELVKLRNHVARGRDIRTWQCRDLDERVFHQLVADHGHGQVDLVERGLLLTKAVNRQAKRTAAIAAGVKTVQAKLAALVKQLAQGTIDTAQFTAAASAILSGGYTQAAQAGVDDSISELGIDPDDSDSDLVSQVASDRTAKQKPFLGGLATDVLTLTAAGGAAGLVDTLASRLGMYANSLQGAYEQAYGQNVSASDVSPEIYWRAQDGCCDKCQSYEDGNPYTDVSTLPGWPGDGDFGDQCDGGPNCRCWLDYNVGANTQTSGYNTQNTNDAYNPDDEDEDLAAAARPGLTKDFTLGAPVASGLVPFDLGGTPTPTVDKADVNYRDAIGTQRCSNCSMWVPGGQCTLVRGPIEPDDVCDRWEPAPATKGAHQDPKDLAQQVVDLLSDDYPADRLGWITDPTVVNWTGPTLVPLNQIDFGNSDSWAASHDDKRVAKWVKRIKSGKVKPAVMVTTPDNRADVVVDGHHRTLAYRQLGRPVLAYVGETKTTDGPWMQLHNYQHRNAEGPDTNKVLIGGVGALDLPDDPQPQLVKGVLARWASTTDPAGPVLWSDRQRLADMLRVAGVAAGDPIGYDELAPGPVRFGGEEWPLGPMPVQKVYRGMTVAAAAQLAPGDLVRAPRAHAATTDVRDVLDAEVLCEIDHTMRLETFGRQVLLPADLMLRVVARTPGVIQFRVE